MTVERESGEETVESEITGDERDPPPNLTLILYFVCLVIKNFLTFRISLY